ncbi:hypothetical protein KXW27_001232, partial [Aspergillus fumigatus]
TGKALTESQYLDEIINLFIGSATAANLVSFGSTALRKSHIVGQNLCSGLANAPHLSE